MTAFIEVSANDLHELHAKWQALREQQPALRIRNAADQLDVSELQLLLSQPEAWVTRLEPHCGEILTALETLGPVMTLTRNDEVVHETTGTVKNFKVTAQGAMGLCLGEIDLRVFFNKWAHAYAVSEPDTEGQVRHSLQFFTASGDALFKIYRGAHTHAEAWSELVGRYASEEQRPLLRLLPRKPYQRNVDNDADWQAFREDWENLQDVHDFHGMLQKHGLDRLTALENIGVNWAQQVRDDSLETLLQRSATTSTPLMLFVGNPGVVQIFTGTVNVLRRTGPWYNVLDPHFNLHANTEKFASTWVVKRPSTDGDITSLECFNTRGELVLTVFGERKPGKPELDSWRARIAELEAM